jgi:formylglycine-generating enzyme required for sulfatase activity
MSRWGFDRDQQPVIDVSWYHATAWTKVQSGLYLLTDAQWEWSAQGGERNLEYGTENGKLFNSEGKKLVHYCSMQGDERTTIDVDDPRYPDGPFGLRHKSGNVWEWVERNHNEDYQYGLRGGSWYYDDLPGLLRVAYRYDVDPDYRGFHFGFRVGASAPQDSKQLENRS